MGVPLREAYGQALVEIGRAHPEVVVLDADLSKATKTDAFAKEFPDRFFNVGIAEANLVGVAAGLSLAGLVPFASTFAVFVPGRAYDQLRNTVCYSKLNVKLVSTHAGLATGEDGGSHQALEDLALTRVLPGLAVYSPADAAQTRALVRYLAVTSGPAYVRLPRGGAEAIYSDEYTYDPRADVLRPGGDATIIATGLAVGSALEAAADLAREGYDCRVVNVHCLKPLDEEAIRRAAAETGCLVTVEDHSLVGGLGSAVLETLAEEDRVPVFRVGVRDRFGQSGPADRLYQEYGLTAAAVTERVRAAIQAKRGERDGCHEAR